MTKTYLNRKRCAIFILSKQIASMAHDTGLGVLVILLPVGNMLFMCLPLAKAHLQLCQEHLLWRCDEKENLPLSKLLKEITTAVRQADPHHIIFIEGNCWGNNYAGMLPFPVENIVISFHKFYNYNNVADIQKFLEIREKYNVPIWMGESGENSNAWFTDAISLFEKHKIGWAWWPLKKLGVNNPLQVKVNPGYQQLVDYWKGNGTNLSSEEAAKALMQLAEDSKLENTIYQKDVIDAMFRQVRTASTLPFKNNTVDGSTIIYATDYDLGRSNFAYHDKDSANYRVATGKNIAWNKGRLYRNDGVDIEKITDSLSNGFGVTQTEAGEWMQYTVNVSKEGNYTISFRSAAKDSAGQLQLVINNQSVSNAISLPPTGDDIKWNITSEKKTIRFKKGINTLRIMILSGGFNFNYLHFEQLHHLKK